MAGDEASSGDRTEAATPRRLQRAREEGNVAISREVSSLAGLIAGIAAVSAVFSWDGVPLLRTLRGIIAISGRADLSERSVADVLRETGTSAATFTFPVLAAVAAAVIASTLVQSGLILNVQALAPNLGRVNPARGIARLVGPANLVEAAKSLVKVVVFGLVIWRELANSVASLISGADQPAARVGAHLAQLLIWTAFPLLALQVVIAATDVVWVRFHRLRQLRMSRQDVKDEMKESEGNPQVRARLRAIRRARSRQQMMKAVQSASVVLTNPTHYAVALAYDRASKAAPKVVAKGADEVAFRIRDMARAHRVPVIPNPPLARILFTVPLDQEIPRDQFQAVAAVIAYLWRINQRQGRPIA